VSSPKLPTTVSVAPLLAGSGAIATLNLSLSSNYTGSSPFIDYTNDTAYVASDSGKLFKINNVFCSTITCQNTPALPSLDLTWSQTVGTGQPLTSPVRDQTTQNVFVGSADGKLYAFNSSCVPLGNSPVIIGSGGLHGDVKGGPIVDSTNGFVYTAAGANGGGSGVMVQTDTQLGSKQTANVGQGGIHDINLPTVNDAYFTQTDNTQWFLYVAGVGNAPGNAATLFRIGFAANRAMNTAVDPTGTIQLSPNPNEISPLTNVMNSGVDRLFVSLGADAVIRNYDITGTGTPTAINTPLSAANGTGGIIIDNVRPEAQASSVYFMTMAPGTSCGTHICAVKATQNGLN